MKMYYRMSSYSKLNNLHVLNEMKLKRAKETTHACIERNLSLREMDIQWRIRTLRYVYIHKK